MKRFLFTFGIASVVFVSCGSESTTTDSTNTTTTTDSPMITPAPDTTNNALPPVVQDTSKTSSIIKMPPATLPVSQPAGQSQPSTTSVALNPEHGKPGHRCDIAVGAPLNSPAGNVGAATPTVTTTPVSTGTTAPATGTKPKLNPAHGQPYHDCSIEVGKPLKS